MFAGMSKDLQAAVPHQIVHRYFSLSNVIVLYTSPSSKVAVGHSWPLGSSQFFAYLRMLLPGSQQLMKHISVGQGVGKSPVGLLDCHSTHISGWN